MGGDGVRGVGVGSDWEVVRTYKCLIINFLRTEGCNGWRMNCNTYM